MRRAVAVLLATAAAGCGPKEPAASSGSAAASSRPAVIDRAIERIEDPLEGVARVRALVKIVKPGGPGEGTATWGGWIPVNGKGALEGDGDGESLGDMDMVLSMLRARTMVRDLVSSRVYAWSKRSGVHRGTTPQGGFVSVRLDDEKRITFVRSDAPYQPRALDIRYAGDTGWVKELDAKDEDIDIAIRWTRRDDGMLDVDAALSVTGMPELGEVHVRILEVERAP